MRILYGVQGTGHGHETRARAVAEEFNEMAEAGVDVEVDYIFSGRDVEKFNDMEVFDDAQYRKGFRFISTDGKINPLKTLMASNPIRLASEAWMLDLSKYDVVITDYEPVVAWAKRLQPIKRLLGLTSSNAPVIGMGHQYSFQHDVPKANETGLKKLQQYFMNRIVPVDTSLGLHWSQFDNQPILPSIVHVPEKQPTIPNKILVYLGFENIENVVSLLENFPEYNFHIYSNDKPAGVYGNIIIKQKGDGFREDMADCAGLITGAGFESPSEAIQLGIPILVKPQKGQIEQQANAIALEQLNLGMAMPNLSKEKVHDWLGSLESYGFDKRSYPNVAKAIAHWIVKGDYNHKSELIESLWQQSTHTKPYQNQNPCFSYG